MEKVKIGLAKGRLATEAIELLSRCGIDCSSLREKSRKLVFDLPQKNLQVILLKASDVATYVEHGVVDIGVVGKDVLLEQQKQLYEIMDLKFGECRLAVAGKKDFNRDGGIGSSHMRVATKYPNIARQYFIQQGQSVEIIKQEGSVELAPIMGLTDVIVDIVETGSTLKANGLVVLEEVMEVSAQLVANRVSFKMKNKEITELMDLMAEVIKREEKEDDQDCRNNQ